MKTYGRLKWHPAQPPSRPKPLWALQAEPHVLMRVKRLFPRARQERAAGLVIADTAEVARDLEWLLSRWPLDMDAVTAERVQAGADAHRATEDTVRRILEGHRPPESWLEPARPARDYQLDADAFVAATGHMLLADDVGLGKSMSAILRLRDPAALPALVVTLTHLPQQWAEEVRLTLPWLQTHIATRATPYDPRTRRGVNRAPDVLILNYAKLAGWAGELAGKVRTVIFDEVQELRRDGTLKYEAAQMVAWQAAWREGLSATPVYNYGGEAYNVVNVIAPDALGTREEFIREWGAGSRNDNILVKDPEALGAYLRDSGIMLQRTRKQVGRELPAAITVPMDVGIDDRELEALMAAEGVAGFARAVLEGEGREAFLAAGELDWRLRKVTGLAKAPFVAEFVRLLLESEEKVALFGWHHEVYDLWAERLAEFDPVFYTGRESPRRKRLNAEAFLDGSSRVLVMSLRAGAGLDGLQRVCKVLAFGEFDWSPGVHEQCVGRFRRDGQDDEPVVAYYLAAADGSDPVVMDALGVKRRQSDPLMNPGGPRLGQAADTTDRMRRLAEKVLRG